MVDLNTLSDNPGSRKKRMRVGRGPGSGKGKTAGRGVKGQTSRTGHGINGFEGGQMPLHMRMPKRGFRSYRPLKFAEVNLGQISKAVESGRLDPTQDVDATSLKAAGLVRRERDGVKLLGDGELSVKLTFIAYAATASAIKKISEAGGTLTLTKKSLPENASKEETASKDNRA